MRGILYRDCRSSGADCRRSRNIRENLLHLREKACRSNDFDGALGESFAEILCLKSQPPTCGMIRVSKPITRIGRRYDPQYTTRSAPHAARVARPAPAGTLAARQLSPAHPGLGRGSAPALRPGPLRLPPPAPDCPVL